MEGLDLIDRLIELSVLDGRETEIARWLTYEDKASILDAILQHGRGALANVTKGGITLYSRELRQAIGHDADFLNRAFLSPSPPNRQSLLAYTGPTKILLIWADHKHASSTAPVIDSRSPFQDRAKYLKAGTELSADSVIFGYELCATMQLRTPLCVLEQHRRIERCNQAKLPPIVTEAWQGIWEPKARSFRDMGDRPSGFSGGFNGLRDWPNRF